MKEFKFKTTFSSILKPLVSEEKDKLLAIASLSEIGKFLPQVDTTKNVDLLPVSFNACVINRVNKNGDVIDTPTALAIYKQFIPKPIDIEHNRQRVIGVILTAGFSEFGTDKPLSEDVIATMTSPFNITLGGVIWRIVNPELADKIEEASDPSSEDYLTISASWELGFTEFKIIELDTNQKNTEGGIIISDAQKIDELKNKLKPFGGDGKLSEARSIYRMPCDDVLPLGIGFTKKPAADVKGIATQRSTDALPVPTILSSEEEDKKNISQSNKIDVKIERNTCMKITSLQDITDENLKQTTASDISEFIATELKKASTVWETEKNALSNQLAEATKTAASNLASNQELQANVKQLQVTIDTLQAAENARKQVEQFNIRMAKIDEAYELDDEAKAVVAEEIKALASDEEFEKWNKKASVFLKGFAKKCKAQKCAKCGKEPCECEKEEDMEAKKKCKASENAQASIDAALDAAKKEKGGLPNTIQPETPSLKEKYKTAFSKENLIITM